MYAYMCTHYKITVVQYSISCIQISHSLCDRSVLQHLSMTA